MKPPQEELNDGLLIIMELVDTYPPLVLLVLYCSLGDKWQAIINKWVSGLLVGLTIYYEVLCVYPLIIKHLFKSKVGPSNGSVVKSEVFRIAAMHESTNDIINFIDNNTNICIVHYLVPAKLVWVAEN